MHTEGWGWSDFRVALSDIVFPRFLPTGSFPIRRYFSTYLVGTQGDIETWTSLGESYVGTVLAIVVHCSV